LAYVQSPAGQRYLSSTSLAIDTPRAIAAPVSRILWSVQAGIVLALAGVGLWFAKNNVIEEIAALLYIVSILAVALGVGFVVSALVSYGLSLRLGLLQAPERSPHA
jgi:heme/copper-type cytochrome/quinol oxidase subunit 3